MLHIGHDSLFTIEIALIAGSQSSLKTVRTWFSDPITLLIAALAADRTLRENAVVTQRVDRKLSVGCVIAENAMTKMSTIFGAEDEANLFCPSALGAV
jgi:hypothetical protein